MPRLKQAGREANNPYANQLFDMLFGNRDVGISDEQVIEIAAPSGGAMHVTNMVDD